MYARVNFIFGEPGRVAAGIARIEDVDREVVRATAGSRGLTTLVDRSGGVIVAISYWDEPLHSSEAALTQARQAAVAAVDGSLVVERYEVVVDGRSAVPAAGAQVRMTRAHVDPTRMDEWASFVERRVLPAAENVPGFCSVELLVDRVTGISVLMSAWVDEHAAAAGESALGALREAAETELVISFPRTETYAVVRSGVLV